MRSPAPAPFDAYAITRPHPPLVKYSAALAAFSLLGFPFVFLRGLVRYRTLWYRLHDEGISMSWGLLFRREVNLTYRRIQDIHVTRNLIQRWTGLASVAIQTASAGATPEMTLEGILEPDALRDFLYTKMRGAREEPGDRAAGAAAERHLGDEALELLQEIRDALRRLESAAARREER